MATEIKSFVDNTVGLEAIANLVEISAGNQSI